MYTPSDVAVCNGGIYWKIKSDTALQIAVGGGFIMSSAETSSVCTPRPDYGSQAHIVLPAENGEAVNSPTFKNWQERSLTFHQVSYVVSMNCGLKNKLILDECRYVLYTIQAINTSVVCLIVPFLQRHHASWIERCDGPDRQWQDNVSCCTLK